MELCVLDVIGGNSTESHHQKYSAYVKPGAPELCSEFLAALKNKTSIFLLHPVFLPGIAHVSLLHKLC